MLGPQTSPDLYVLQLPLANGESWLSAFVFIGGLSAATSMVIVACMALSGMIGNELVMPYLLRRRAGVAQDMGPLVVFVRRAAVVLILLAGYAYERIISGYLPLASIGMISFCAVANFAPGLVLGLYWRRAHRYGVVAGLAGGFVVWLYALLLPTLRQTAGGGQVAPLKPYLPAPLAELDPVGQGFVVGILINALLLVGVSLLVRARGSDAEQADAFVLGAEPEQPQRQAPADAARIDELRELLTRFVGDERARRALPDERAVDRDGAGPHRARAVGHAGGGVGAHHRRRVRPARPALPAQRARPHRRGLGGDPLQLRDPAQHARPCRHGHRRLRPQRPAGDLQRPLHDAAVARRHLGGGRRLADASSAPRPRSWPCCAGPTRRRPTRSRPGAIASSSSDSIRCPAAASSPPATT